MTPCPRCGVTDRDQPCVGGAAFGGHPLRYRHAGREPPSNQARLEAPLLRGDTWDTACEDEVPPYPIGVPSRHEED